MSKQSMLMATQFVENLLESQQKTVDIRIQASHIFSRPLFRQNSMCDIRTQALICKPFVYDEAMEHLNKVAARIKEIITRMSMMQELDEGYKCEECKCELNIKNRSKDEDLCKNCYSNLKGFVKYVSSLK